MGEVPWREFIFHPKYSNIVDIFEGGFMHTRGVYRSEQNSCMNNEIPYYNTISRYEIAKRIMEYAEESFSIEQFIANDIIENSSASPAPTKGRNEIPLSRNAGEYSHHPIFMGERQQIK